jgi:hypothetical protein
MNHMNPVFAKASLTRLGALAIALVLAVTLALAHGTTSNGADGTSAATTAAKRSIAHNQLGKAKSRVVGTTGNDRRVTGSFYPLDFKKSNGKVRVRGMLTGVVHRANGSTDTFTAVRILRVKSVNGTPAHARAAGAQAAAVCDILHLVLGPLDLDLLGLQVHLNRVVLDIVAESGPGNLLGNLLCAVAGLLDGGLQGALGRLVRLLDDILGALRLGL